MNYKCTICKLEKTEKDFYFTNSYRRKYCKLCEHASQTKRRVNKKLKVVELMGGKCVDCGYNKSAYALELHHIDPSTKEYEPSQLISRLSWDKIYKEMEKCELLCANCHRIKTFAML